MNTDLNTDLSTVVDGVDTCSDNEAAVYPSTPVIYKDADLLLKCTCGHTTLIESNVPEGAIRYEVYTVQGSNIPLMCEKCKHKLTLYFETASTPLPLTETDSNIEAEEVDNNIEAEEVNDNNIEDEPVPENRQV